MITQMLLVSSFKTHNQVFASLKLKQIKCITIAMANKLNTVVIASTKLQV